MSAPQPERYSAADPVYQMRGLVKEYAERRVLDIEALDIYPGEVFGLVGPSGSGKSTLLRLLNFLEPPSQGELHYEGAAFSPGQTVPLEIRRRVTTVFQRPMLLDRSVYDNVLYGLKLRRSDRARETIQAVLEEVGMDGLARQRARTLSGGEAQRVALARAMALAPSVLLLDEPTANLDPYNVNLIEKIIQRLNAAHRMTIILVTHNIFQARRLANRIAFLLDGKIIENAPTEAFFNFPTDPRTRAFIAGDMIY
ncbi:MAG: phosphate ABC transporter ATP-binding protein [Anaerolineales bacterium]|jgi:tungstate transport system ATP-binding protein|nr:phosphate ABC transporter ATP-binding protein [Anaerolineales bacterium]